jgi:ribosomal protein S18 acetylase RimI-like enzyme
MSSEPTVRALRAEDLDAIVRIDARVGGRPRPEYLHAKLTKALDEGMQMSLGAEIDGRLVGFLMGAVYYGEFGRAEPVATIETIGVHPDFWQRGVGRALWAQFARNMRGLRVGQVQTQVGWNDWRLLAFLERVGFTPAPRVCLQSSLDVPYEDVDEG